MEEQQTKKEEKDVERGPMDAGLQLIPTEEEAASEC